MKKLKTRSPRIAGLMALALAAVAALALTGIAAAKDRGRDDNGHHGRHHGHRIVEMKEAGTVSTFDAKTGRLTIALDEEGTVSGLVTGRTEIKCEGLDDRLTRRDHGGDDHGGSGEPEPGDDHGGQNEPGDDNGGQNEPGDDNGGEAGDHGGSCSQASLVPGAVVDSAELRLEGGKSVFKEIELGHHS